MSPPPPAPIMQQRSSSTYWSRRLQVWVTRGSCLKSNTCLCAPFPHDRVGRWDVLGILFRLSWKPLAHRCLTKQWPLPPSLMGGNWHIGLAIVTLCSPIQKRIPTSWISTVVVGPRVQPASKRTSRFLSSWLLKLPNLKEEEEEAEILFALSVFGTSSVYSNEEWRRTLVLLLSSSSSSFSSFSQHPIRIRRKWEIVAPASAETEQATTSWCKTAQPWLNKNGRGEEGKEDSKSGLCFPSREQQRASLCFLLSFLPSFLCCVTVM